MNPRFLLAAAAAVVLASNLWVPLAVRRNQVSAAGGTLTLTERELALQPRPGESTVTLLEFRWRRDTDYRHTGPAWLDQAKLASLGFDCHVPLSAPEARDHYRKLGNLPAWLVLTLTEPAPGADAAKDETRTRLTVVDASRDAGALRQQYPNLSTHAIVPGAVRLMFVDRSPDSPETPVEPRLQGWIAAVLPMEIFVPRPFSALLNTPTARAASTPDRPSSDLHYTATVSWGTRHTPWLQEFWLNP